MRFLIRLAFWLGVVFYFLPAHDTPPAASQARAAGGKTMTENLSASGMTVLCALRPAACSAAATSQETLNVSDLAPPWRKPPK